MDSTALLPHAYSDAGDLKDESETRQPSCTHCRDSVEPRSIRHRLCPKLPWALCVFFLLGWIGQGIFSKRYPSDGFWRDSESGTAKIELSKRYKDVRFEANLLYNETRQLYRPTPSPDYVGPPNAETDAAWEDLLGTVDVFISPDEAKELEGELWQDPETGLYMAQVTVFHDLHCMNMIRKALHIEHYRELLDYTFHEHINHCIDAIRESLMCSGDTTLIPVRWSENRGWIKPDFATVHTCRDYTTLRQWSRDRDAEHPAVYPENARRLRAQWGLEPWSGTKE